MYIAYASSSCGRSTIGQEEIHCVQVHDVKEAVLELVANHSIACFAPQGTGVKIYNWSGVPKHINFNKTVKCLAMMGDKLYCGCTAFSIQCITVNNDFIFTATRFGTIEAWLKERVTRVASIKMGSGGNAKITCLTSDKDGQMLFAASSDGKIQVKF
ncbi:hypothetical protein POM88_017984 [Heracleum sosnowskyi]|uniref:Uncharacterized protein n=1 Tax=Heracleum sosnowskyi TaxID=360622 RepID=A0AAD8MYQ4_9APIA|nr:hypothetical protein POM88_017984 [Heracleum sosnowskyi]